MAWLENLERVCGNFTKTTSSHGIPMIGYMKDRKHKVFWFFVFLTGFSIFGTQANSMIRRFLRYEKNVNVELKFETAPFPAVTICNLNPYKQSLIRQIKSISKTMQVFDHMKKTKRKPAVVVNATVTNNKESVESEVTSNSLNPRPKRSEQEDEEMTEASELLGELWAQQRRELERGGEGPSRLRRIIQMDPSGLLGLAAGGRRRRAVGSYQYEPVLAFCRCESLRQECRPIMKPTQRNVQRADQRCICFRQTDYNIVSPCYSEKAWQLVECARDECTATGRCRNPSDWSKEEKRQLMGDENTVGCRCPAFTNYCVIEPATMPTLGDPKLFETTTTSTTTTSTTTTSTTTTSTTTTSTTTTTTPTTTSTTTTTTTPPPYTGPTTIDPGLIDALGFEGMTDQVAIVTKAKENLVFTMAALPMATRRALSYSKEELLTMCSFNGKECNIHTDFILHPDPVYGNCYIFNWDNQHNRTSTRAGPMYGLRLLVYNNVSDYMGTTEAKGARLQIHSQEQVPFPDTFGYSAPTGFVSSFGVRLKAVKRLGPPFGTCVDQKKAKNIDNWVYGNFSYSTEGCYRSCFQRMLLAVCGCADPRFPKPDDTTYCQADSSVERLCLDNATTAVGGFHGMTDCSCPQPCHQEVFGVSYSAAVWPSDDYDLGDDCPENDTDCALTYRNNAAMLEIFYEMLNFELLEETEAYGWASLLADFGGQLGLWMGISVITSVEVVVFILQLCLASCGIEFDEVMNRREGGLASRAGSVRRPRELGSAHPSWSVGSFPWIDDAK